MCIDKSGLACIALRVYWSFSSIVGVKICTIFQKWKPGPIPEEMSQTLLTNKKQEIPDHVYATNIIKGTVSRDFLLPVFFMNHLPPSP
jgi:hypothetical protein